MRGDLHERAGGEGQLVRDHRGGLGQDHGGQRQGVVTVQARGGAGRDRFSHSRLDEKACQMEERILPRRTRRARRKKFNHKERIEKIVGAALCGCPERVSEGRI